MKKHTALAKPINHLWASGVEEIQSGFREKYVTMLDGRPAFVWGIVEPPIYRTRSELYTLYTPNFTTPYLVFMLEKYYEDEERYKNGVKFEQSRLEVIANELK